MTPAPLIDALGPGGARPTLRRSALPDVFGRPAGLLARVPAPVVRHVLRELREASPVPADDRGPLLAAAADLIRSGRVAGSDREEYLVRTCRLTGLPRSVVADGLDSVAERMRHAAQAVELARPAGARLAGAPGTTSGAHWIPRGDVLAVVAAGNHPGTQGVWPEAVALGLRVAVRPSRREPFTAQRVVHALHAVGLGSHAAYLPTDQAEVTTLVDAADLALVYGGSDMERRYADRADVLVQGPGRSKVLVLADALDDDADRVADLVADSVAGRGGTGCVNATGVLVEGDAEPLFEAVADRLARLDAGVDVLDPAARLPVHTAQEAEALAAAVLRRARGCRRRHPADAPIMAGPEGTTVLRPITVLLDRQDERLSAEYPSSVAWFAPWEPTDGVSPLRGSLVVTVLGSGPIVDDLIREPSIANVYSGVPTHRMSFGVPHDGFLADFLMRTTGFIRSA